MTNEDLTILKHIRDQSMRLRALANMHDLHDIELLLAGISTTASRAVENARSRRPLMDQITDLRGII